MYPLLSTATVKTLLGLFVVAAIGAWSLVEVLSPSTGLLRFGPFFATVVVGVVGLLMRGHHHWTPWRRLWRAVPQLNDWAYPDLNGVWVGSIRSNWPVIQRLSQAVPGDEPVDEKELASVPLGEGRIAVEVRADLYSVRLVAATEGVGGTSRSVTARPRRCADSEVTTISYVYVQSTPDPEATDESTHVGAAELRLEKGRSGVLEGEYWTRRRWRLGQNTAGRIELRRVSDRRDPERPLSDYFGDGTSEPAA
ncbi:MAG: hypothetical protein AAFU61_13520 [Pseudomonadota bacterium]